MNPSPERAYILEGAEVSAADVRRVIRYLASRQEGVMLSLFGLPVLLEHQARPPDPTTVQIKAPRGADVQSLTAALRKVFESLAEDRPARCESVDCVYRFRCELEDGHGEVHRATNRRWTDADALPNSQGTAEAGGRRENATGDQEFSQDSASFGQPSGPELAAERGGT